MGPSTGRGPHPTDPGRWPARFAAVLLTALLATLGMAPAGAAGTPLAGDGASTTAVVSTSAGEHLRSAHADHGQPPRVHELLGHPGTPTTPPPSVAVLPHQHLATPSPFLRPADPTPRASKRPAEHLPYRGRGPPEPAGN